jgi:hypothetical protein
MKPGSDVRALNLELKELMCEISGIIRHLIRGGLGDGGTHCPVVVEESGAAGDKELGIVSIDQRVQIVSSVAP